MNCKHCGKILRSNKYEFCYTCRQELNKKPAKYCTRCGKKLHNSKNDICYTCRQELNKKPVFQCDIEGCQHTVKSTSTSFEKTGRHLCTEHYNEWKHTHKVCPHCHKEYAEFSLSENELNGSRQKYCNECLNNMNYDSIMSEMLMNNDKVKSDLRHKIFQDNIICKFFYDKLFNKSNCKSVANYQNMNKDMCNKLSSIINSFVNNICENNTYTMSDNNITVWHLHQIAIQRKGWFLDKSLFELNISEISFEKELYGIYTTYENLNYNWQQKYNFINALQCLKTSSKQGNGEVFLALLCNNISAENSANTGDICMMKNNNKTLCELKFGDNKNNTGRLCFARPNWISVLNKNFSSYKDKLMSISYLNDSEKDLIKNTVINEFTFECLYKNIMYSLWQRNKQYAEYFCLYMINNFMFDYNPDITFFTYRFIDSVKFSEDKNFEDSWNKFTFFAMINSLVYYFEVDAKSENLDSIAFMSLNKCMYITRKSIVEDSYNELMSKLENLVYVWPSSEVTKKDNNENDRNKNRAPGAFVK